MDILLFLGGFLTGTVVVSIIFFVVQNKSKSSSDEIMKQMQLYFENTANKIFKESSEDFSNVNKEKLEDFFSKFKEKIEDFEKRTNINFEVEKEKLSRFDENIKEFIGEGKKISENTTSLVSVMKSDNRTQGQWGEIVLERVLEASGLRKDEEYFLQKGNTSEGRPDAIVNLPEKKCVMIDAKTSLASFSSYVEAENEEDKMKFLKEFKESTKAHITGLAKRDYSPSDDSISTQYILMFIPIESCYSLMFCEENTLWDFAWKNNIMPVSPSTLLASLKIINAFLMVDRQNKNALEISRLCSKMLDKFSDMTKDILNARKNIVSALKRLDGRDSILVNIEKVKDLGITMSKPMPELGDDILEEDL